MARIRQKVIQKMLMPLYGKISEWPDNEYTKAILKPDVEEMDYTLFDENTGYYAVFLKNVTIEDGKQYIQLLKENGFESVSNDTNFVTIGEILKKDTTGLSVSASENVLALYITLNAEEAQKGGVVWQNTNLELCRHHL